MKSLFSKGNLQKGGLALGGMIVGAIVGIVVQVGVETTGLLGPGVEELLTEQEANFDEMKSRLESLKQQADDPAMRESLAELGQLLARQGELQDRSSTDLAYLSARVADMEAQQLEERGFAGGADVWLGVGESISVGDRSHVLGVVRMWNNAADVNFNGTKSRLSVGDVASVEGLDCAVFLKQAMRQKDARAGFDVTCG